MSSSAEKLLERMREWARKDGGIALIAERSDENGRWWSRHAEAVVWFLDLDEAVEQRDRPALTEAWGAVRGPVARAIFATNFPDAWDSGRAHEFLSEAQLAGLAGVVDSVTQLSDVIARAPEAREALDVLANLRSHIDTAPDLADELKHYLLVLIARVEEALTEAVLTGTADVRALADQLIGTLYRLFDVDGECEESKNFVNLAKRFGAAMSRFLNSPLVSAIAGGITGGFAGQITGS
ncbi:MAG: hypothetical protein E7L06_08230 [Schaalia turicensis]|nr:hypothetical protein [Schaalia turicensis]